MPENYSEAAIRHYEDSERLARDSRFDNAGHLIGFAVECAIKHHFGVTASATSPKTHLPDIAASMRRRFSARNPDQAAMYALLNSFGSSFFAGWSVNDRYSQNGNVAEEQYSRWREQARRTLGAARLRSTGGAI